MGHEWICSTVGPSDEPAWHFTDYLIETGDLVSLANHYGKEPLEVVVYADIKDEVAISLLDIWSWERRSAGDTKNR